METEKSQSEVGTAGGLDEPRGVALVQADGVAKAFGPTQALVDVSFDLLAGEVHVLAGENGSGKSTLVKILSGVHTPDSGSIAIRRPPAPGAPVAESSSSPQTPRAAHALGVATVFQEVLVAESSSVLDNAWLGYDGLVRKRVADRTKRSLAQDAFDRLLGYCPDLDTPVGDLSLSDRQACGIVRALLREPQILILDEATSSLDFEVRSRLFEIIEGLTKKEVGVVFISHRLDEMSEIGDRMTVMRSGQTVATLGRGAWTPEELVQLMTGTDPSSLYGSGDLPPPNLRRGSPVLKVRELVLREDRRPIDIEMRAGELVGVAGLEGHGQQEFLEALRGLGAVQGEVVRHEQDWDVVIRSASHAGKHGIAYVPQERSQSLFHWMSIWENFGMPTLGRDRRFRWLMPDSTQDRFDRYSQELAIVLEEPGNRITTLSGGNQQKVILARWLAAEPRVLLLNDPTRGIDIKTKRDVYALLKLLATRGLAIVMSSSELDELIELMDRVLIFREHELVEEMGREALTRRSIVAAFFDHDIAQPLV